MVFMGPSTVAANQDYRWWLRDQLARTIRSRSVQRLPELGGCSPRQPPARRAVSLREGTARRGRRTENSRWIGKFSLAVRRRASLLVCTALGSLCLLSGRSRVRVALGVLAQPREARPAHAGPHPCGHADQHGSQLTRAPCPGRSNPGGRMCAVPGLREALRLEERAGVRAPEQPYRGEADQPGQHGDDHAEHRYAEPVMDHHRCVAPESFGDGALRPDADQLQRR